MQQDLCFEKCAVVLKTIFLQALIALFISSTSFAQNQPVVRVIKGTVTDAQTNEALQGVSVGIKETHTVVQTDKNGNYSISAGSTSIITFSYVGSKTEE